MTSFAILASGLAFPEGPAAAPDGAIWVSEMRHGCVTRIAADGTLDRIEVGGTPNGLAFAPDGALWFCDAGGNRIRRLDVVAGTIETMADAIDGQPLAAPNDLAFDPDGGLVFSCPGDSRSTPTGYLCRRDAAGRVARIAERLLFPNGLCFSPDGERLILAETYGMQVRTAAWTAGAALDLVPLFQTPGPIGADGVAVLPDGRIATCVHDSGLVRIAAPSGAPIEDIAVPDGRPAGCMSDPRGDWPLIVTGTEHGLLIGIAP